MGICKISYVQITWGKCRWKQRHVFSQPEVWGYHGTCAWDLLRKRWRSVGRAWPRPLASVESWPCSHFPARLWSKLCITAGLCGLTWSLPFLPAGLNSQAMKESPCSQAHASFEMVYWLLPSYFGSFCRRLWNLIYAPGPPIPATLKVD